MFAERAAPCLVVIAALFVAMMSPAQNGADAFPTRSLLSNGTTGNCSTNYYGTSCTTYCHTTETCNSLGTCGTEGDCLCSAVTNYGKHCNLTLTLPAGVAQPPALSFVPGTASAQTLMSGSKFAWSIPAGALGGATTLTPSILDQSSFSTAGQSELGAAAGYFLQLRPKGTVFLVPITVTFGVDATVAVPSGYTVKVFKLDDTTNTWVEVAGSSYDPVDGSVSVDMSSFSIYGTFVVLDPASSVVSKKGQADSTVVVAIVLAVVLSVLLIVAAMWAVAYYKNKELHRGAAPEVYNPATTAV